MADQAQSGLAPQRGSQYFTRPTATFFDDLRLSVGHVFDASFHNVSHALQGQASKDLKEHVQGVRYFSRHLLAPPSLRLFTRFPFFKLELELYLFELIFLIWI